MNLPIYEDNECILATKELSKHVNGKEAFSLEMPNVGLGISVTGDLSKKSYRQSYYKDCIFESTICRSIGFSGSKFIKTVFQNCIFDNANLHSCDFQNVTFIGSGDSRHEIFSAGFHKSTFSDCTFQNLFIFSCGFTDVVFYNTVFQNCTIRLCSLENAQFRNCYFINTNMSTLNLEYTEFDGISATQTIFPFATIPSAFGLLQQLPSLSEDNVVYTAANESHELSIQEYCKLLSDFERFYYKKKKYYALANIYVSQGKAIDSFNAIEAGILSTIKIKDFRILRHFCKLVYLSDIFTIQQRRNLYENISRWVSQENLKLSEYHNYQLFSGQIRELLLNRDYHNLTLYFYLKTNIESDEIKKQVTFLTIIDQILTYCNVSLSSIELRHNSAFVDFLTVVCDNLTQFSQVLIMIYGSLAGVKLFASDLKKLSDTTQDIISSNDQHKLNKLEQKKLELEIESIKHEQDYKKRMDEIEYQKAIAELEKIKLEIEDMEKQANEYQKILLENGIEICVHHTSKNLKVAPIREMLQYNQQH